jgi:hypothetical protein
LDNVVDQNDFDIVDLNMDSYGSHINWTDGDATGDQGMGNEDLETLYEHDGIDLTSIWMLADLDGDRDVDDDDLVIFDDNYGMANPTPADGDLDDDGDIDAADLHLMFAQYGAKLAAVS